MTVTVNLHGFSQLSQRLSRLAKEDATKAGQVANRAGATVLRKAVVNEAPVSQKTTEGETRNRGTRTETHGKIKNNVIVRKTKSATTSTQVQNSVGVKKNAYHASFVQFGSIHNSADPFMLRALQSNEQPIIDAIGRSLNKQLVRRGI